MQHGYHPDLSTEHIGASQASQELGLNAVFLLTPADKAVLQDHLDDFQDGDKAAHAIIIE